jgi:hypothetical protein
MDFIRADMANSSRAVICVRNEHLLINLKLLNQLRDWLRFHVLIGATMKVPSFGKWRRVVQSTWLKMRRNLQHLSLILKTKTKFSSEQSVNLYNTIGVKTQRILVAYWITKYRTKYEKYALLCIIKDTENNVQGYAKINWRHGGKFFFKTPCFVCVASVSH